MNMECPIGGLTLENQRIGKPRISVLICTLNEEENLPHVLPDIPSWVDEIILVDGRSVDRTVEIARRLRPETKVFFQPGVGKGDALKHGMQQVTGDIIVTLDADGATDPRDMPRFVEPLLHGYDFVKGSRFLHTFPRNKPVHRIVGNWIIVMTFNMLFFRWYTDMCSGYSAFWKRAVEGIDMWSSDGFENEPLVNTRVRKYGLRVVEVAHLDKGRIKGVVKEESWRQGFKAVRGIIRERFCK